MNVADRDTDGKDKTMRKQALTAVVLLPGIVFAAIGTASAASLQVTQAPVYAGFDVAVPEDWAQSAPGDPEMTSSQDLDSFDDLATEAANDGDQAAGDDHGTSDTGTDSGEAFDTGPAAGRGEADVAAEDSDPAVGADSSTATSEELT